MKYLGLCLPLMLILILIQACQSEHLKPDYQPSPQELNYFTTEIAANGQTYFGLMATKADNDLPFLFSVYGFHRGTVMVTSEECNVFETKTYATSGMIDIIVPSQHEKRCLFSITVSPEFSERIANLTPWRSTQGLMAVHFTSKDLFTGSYQLKINQALSTSVDVTQLGSRLYARGCGLKLDLNVWKPLKQAKLEIGPTLPTSRCVVDGFIKGTKQDTGILILVSQAQSGLVKLPTPKLEWGPRKLTVIADQSVSILTFQGQTYFGSSVTFDYNQLLSDKTLRGYTAKGRTFACELERGGESKCFH